jgi:surfactin synthase thioesterase subunit
VISRIFSDRKRAIRTRGSPLFLREPALLERSRKALTYDYTIYHSYRYLPASSSLACHLVLFAGDDDPLCKPEHLAGWAEQTSGSTATYAYQGDHSYLRNHLPELADRLMEERKLF